MGKSNSRKKTSFDIIMYKVKIFLLLVSLMTLPVTMATFKYLEYTSLRANAAVNNIPYVTPTITPALPY